MVSGKRRQPENPSFQTISFEVKKDHLSMNPKKFMLWLLLGVIFIFFSGLLAAYIFLALQTETEMQIPQQFYFSTGIIIFSSLTLIMAFKSAQRDEISYLKLWLLVTFVLGLLFLGGQFWGWMTLLSNIEYPNHSESFLYIISGIHAVHILAGLGYLIAIYFMAVKIKIHSRALEKLRMCSTYWHFVGILWIYVFIFLIIFK